MWYWVGLGPLWLMQSIFVTAVPACASSLSYTRGAAHSSSEKEMAFEAAGLEPGTNANLSYLNKEMLG